MTWESIQKTIKISLNVLSKSTCEGTLVVMENVLSSLQLRG